MLLSRAKGFKLPEMCGSGVVYLKVMLIGQNTLTARVSNGSDLLEFYRCYKHLMDDDYVTIGGISIEDGLLKLDETEYYISRMLSIAKEYYDNVEKFKILYIPCKFEESTKNEDSNIWESLVIEYFDCTDVEVILQDWRIKE